MRRFLLFVVLAALIGPALAFGWRWLWAEHLQHRPVRLVKHEAEIVRLLEESGWVSPGGEGAPVWIVSFRACPACAAFSATQPAKYAAAGLDPRVVVFAPASSTPAERTTVAELWLNRDWALYDAFSRTPAADWTAPGLKAAEADAARAAVADASSAWAARLGALLKANAVPEGWPVVIWRDREGALRACACGDPRGWAEVRESLGVSHAALPAPPQAAAPPEPAPGPAAPPAPARAPAAPSAPVPYESLDRPEPGQPPEPQRRSENLFF